MSGSLRSASDRSRRVRPGSLCLTVAALATAGLAAGCGGSSGADSPAIVSPSATTTAPTPAVTPTESTAPVSSPTVAPATPSATPVSHTGPALCQTANLTVTLGQSSGAAGSNYQAIQFTNKGSGSCELRGYPGVSFVAGSAGTQVGPAATESASGIAITSVSIEPGAVASAVLQTTDYLNYPPATCQATAVRGLRVYPPGNTAAAFVALPAGAKACAATRLLTIRPMVAGNGAG